MTDDLLRLGWLTREPAAALALERDLAGKAEAYSDLLIGEASTIAIFVEPILRGLGWDTLDINQVGRESRRGGPTQIGDIHLCVGSLEYAWSLRAVLEVKHLDCKDRHLKGLFEKLREDVNGRLLQGKDAYAIRVRPVPIDGWLLRAALTNGRLWMIYDFLQDAAGATREECIGRFELSGSLSEGELVEFAKHLSREAILKCARG